MRRRSQTLVTAASVSRRRTRARVEGTVQGVGFRPYVYRLANELGLDGFVLNDSHGVLIEVEGSPGTVGEFLSRLRLEAPPLADVERVVCEEREPTGSAGFSIRSSPSGGVADAPVSPDTATCADCLGELLDPADRRFRYPFINCTNCGPRFTIVRGIPYDRPLTTMAAFTMCDRCQAEYEDPADRRFHAQPNACPACGPRVSLLNRHGRSAPLGSPPDPLAAAVGALCDGLILGVKGIGGFHLACRADDERAVAALRARKRREDKPFALMVPDLATAATLVSLGALERQLLESPARPIVLAPRLSDAAVAAKVAPGAPELGVMLPYTPLHHLLLADIGVPLVMTSGNVSDEPIAYDDADAITRLAEIADLFLVHDRSIETRTDDSIVRVVVGARPALLRRSRGYVPASMPLRGGTTRPLLACGAELKSTFCVAKGERAWVSHHIGDLKNYETLRSFSDGVRHFERLFSVAPEVVAHDLHPDYLSTRYAIEREELEPIGVQHHHAHLAACLAEHGEPGPAVGAIFDGSGYGEDGTVWGGELLVGDLAGFVRVGMLHPVRLPGGDRAVREPWRMACAWLWVAAEGDGDAHGDGPALPAALAGCIDAGAWRQVGELARTGLASPLTSSMGRLFDAVAALCGIRAEVNYEGQAAIELEAACDPGQQRRHPISLAENPDAGLLVIDPRETIRAVVADLSAGVSVGVVASRFHAALAWATVESCARAAAAHGTQTVVLSGGVFQNRRLLEAAADGLQRAGLRVLIPERLPMNDGGISFGQAAVAARRLETAA
jgi:hydrogenase maturation protein HypF